MTLLLMTILLLVLLLFRVPVAIALLIPSLVYIFFDPSATFQTAMQQTVSGVNSFPLLAVPLFIMLGNIANAGGISDKLFNSATALIGHVRGSLGYVNVVTSFGFAWISGAAISDAAALGKVQIPAMIKRGYSERFSVGVTAGSALIAPILPPSIPAIIYAVTAGISVGSMFIAGIVPAVIMLVVLSAYVWLSTRKHDELRLERASGRTQVKAILTAIPALGAGVVILGGILGGFFTPTEAAGIGVVYMFILSAAYKRLGKKELSTIFMETIYTSGSVLLIVCAAKLFGWVLSRERAPQVVADLFFSVSENPWIFLIMLNILLFLVGAIMEPTAAILILVPVLAPVAMIYGIDPLHVAMVIVFNLMLGLLTPPVGLVLFVLSSVTGIPVSRIIKGALQSYVPLIIVLLLITFIPALTTWLPGVVGL